MVSGSGFHSSQRASESGKVNVSPSSPRKATLVTTVCVIVAVGLLLRLASAWESYPLVTFYDETAMMQTAVNMLANHDPNPHFFNYPSMLFYVYAALISGVNLVTHQTLPVGVPVGYVVEYFIAGRVLASLAAAASIAVTFLVGREIASSAAGLFAAGLVAVSPKLVGKSAQVTTDIWTATFATAVLLFSVRILRTRAWRDYLLAGAFVGLAAGSKYNAVVFAASVLVAHLLTYERLTFKALVDPKLLLSGVVAVTVFVATTPFAVLDMRSFLHGLGLEAAHYSTGHAGFEASGRSWGLYASALASPHFLGHVGLALALISAAFMLKKEFRGVAVVLALPFALWLFLGQYKVFFDRNILGAVPSLAIAAGFAIYAITQSFPIFQQRPALVSLLFVGLFLVAAAPLAITTFQEVRDKTLPDTRWIALNWIRDNIPPDSRVGLGPSTPPILHSRYGGRFKVEDIAVETSATGQASIDERFDYLIVSSKWYGRYFNEDGTAKVPYLAEAKAYEELFDTHELVYEVSPTPGRSSGPVVRVFRMRPPDP